MDKPTLLKDTCDSVPHSFFYQLYLTASEDAMLPLSAVAVAQRYGGWTDVPFRLFPLIGRTASAATNFAAPNTSYTGKVTLEEH